MSTPGAPRGHLAEVGRVYCRIRRLEHRIEELNTVESALAEYWALVGKDDLDDLVRHQEELKSEHARLTAPLLRRMMPTTEVNPPKKVDPHKQPKIPGPSGTRDPGPILGWSAPREERDRLKKLVNRFAYAWGLDVATQGRINRIADDADQPLGAALSLLPWRVFKDRAPSRESPDGHRDRLDLWGRALSQYHDHLARRTVSLELKYRGVLGIWEAWKRRERDQEGWRQQIDETRQARDQQIEASRREIAKLTAEIRVLKKQARPGEDWHAR